MNPSSPKTTAAGIFSIVMSGLTLFMHIWGVTHGTGQLDPNTLVTGISGVIAGAGLVAAKDNNQPK